MNKKIASVIIGVTLAAGTVMGTASSAQAAYNHTRFYAAKPANVSQKYWIDSGLYACSDLKSRNSWHSRYLHGFPGTSDIFYSVFLDLRKHGYYSAVTFPSLVNATYCPGLTLN